MGACKEFQQDEYFIAMGYARECGDGISAIDARAFASASAHSKDERERSAGSCCNAGISTRSKIWSASRSASARVSTGMSSICRMRCERIGLTRGYKGTLPATPRATRRPQPALQRRVRDRRQSGGRISKSGISNASAGRPLLPFAACAIEEAGIRATARFDLRPLGLALDGPQA